MKKKPDSIFVSNWSNNSLNKFPLYEFTVHHVWVRELCWFADGETILTESHLRISYR